MSNYPHSNVTAIDITAPFHDLIEILLTRNDIDPTMVFSDASKVLEDVISEWVYCSSAWSKSRDFQLQLSRDALGDENESAIVDTFLDKVHAIVSDYLDCCHNADWGVFRCMVTVPPVVYDDGRNYCNHVGLYIHLIGDYRIMEWEKQNPREVRRAEKARKSCTSKWKASDMAMPLQSPKDLRAWIEGLQDRIKVNPMQGQCRETTDFTKEDHDRKRGVMDRASCLSDTKKRKG